ncbi:Pyrin [Merluccius polli]|uniref:Pyrin n=1 Tax=Merluccius polli TaxID=89951 RepID=A0AA47NBQ2_MERPO|nr:Pyrin [Merluccius polli]
MDNASKNGQRTTNTSVHTNDYCSTFKQHTWMSFQPLGSQQVSMVSCPMIQGSPKPKPVDVEAVLSFWMKRKRILTNRLTDRNYNKEWPLLTLPGLRRTFHAPSVWMCSTRAELLKVGVFVDYDEGLVSFYDVEARVHIYSATGCTFCEPLYPLLCSSLHNGGENSAPLIISPVKQARSFV